MTATQLLCVFISVSFYFSSPSHASIPSSIMNLPYLPMINILLFFSSLPYASPVSFHVQQFDANATSIIYEGDAEPVNGAVELTNKVQYVGRVGRATYAERVPLWDSHNRVLSDFNTNFSFLIDKKGQGTYGSGFAFYLAPWGYPIPPNSGAGFLGLFNETTSGEIPGKQVVLVEFDYYVDGEWDPPYQHIGINSNSISSVVCKRWNANLHDGEIIEVWISYNATTTNLSVHWSYKNHDVVRIGEPTSLSYIIDLTKILPEWVSVGFSAGTSQYGERHKILSWKFDSTLDGINAGLSTVTHTNMTHLIRVIIVVAAILITLTIGVLIAEPVGWLFNWLKNIYRKEETIPMTALVAHIPSSSSTHEEVNAGRVSDQDIVPATDSFFEVDMDTAEKKTSSSSGQGRKEFITEVNRICSTRYLV